MATITQSAAPSAATTAKPGLLDSIVEEQQRAAARYQPVMQPEAVHERYKQLKWYIDNMMLEGVDYGAVPGIDKPFLFKPGAQGLCAFFGYVPSYETIDQIKDWSGAEHGEPLFYFEFRCTLLKDSDRVGEGIGSASSWESKYRYRWVPAEFLPAGVDKASLPSRSSSVVEFDFAIEKGETSGPYGKPAAYWQEWRAAMASGEAVETKRKTKAGKEMNAWSRGGIAYRVPNDGFPDVINTTQKQGCKRAYIEATLSATGASRFFTQDEDAVQSMQEYTRPAPAQSSIQAPNGQQKANAPQPEPSQAKPQPSTLDQVLGAFVKKETIKQNFEQLRKHFLETLDIAVWNQILEHFKVNVEVSEFGSIGNAKKCFTACWNALRTAHESMAAEPKPEPYKATDEDIPWSDENR